MSPRNQTLIATYPVRTNEDGKVRRSGEAGGREERGSKSGEEHHDTDGVCGGGTSELVVLK